MSRHLAAGGRISSSPRQGAGARPACSHLLPCAFPTYHTHQTPTHAPSPPTDAKLGESTKLKLDWKTGVAATDWNAVAKKEHLDQLTVELRRLEDNIRVGGPSGVLVGSPWGRACAVRRLPHPSPATAPCTWQPGALQSVLHALVCLAALSSGGGGGSKRRPH